MPMNTLASRRLPARFHLWWVISTLSAAGDSLLAFALIWTATRHGPTAVALVSTLAVVPRIVLMLFGGALGDRHGPRRLLIVTSAVQCVVLALLAALSTLSSGVAVLCIAAGATAAVSAFRQPAATVLPRLMIRKESQFARALARISGSLHVARILGVGLGGIAISALPLAAIFSATMIVAAMSLLVLCAMKLPSAEGTTGHSSPSDTGIWHSLASGIRSAHQLRLWPLLVAVALVCAAVLPTVAVTMPSLARAHGWTAGEASLLEAAWATGTLTITLLISYTGTLPRPRIAMVGGPALICGALAALAATTTPSLAIAICAVIGVGTASFTTHIAPTLLRMAPAGQLARFQALMAIVQLAPPALLNSPLADLSGTGHASAAVLVAAILAGVAGLSVLVGLRDRKSAETADDSTSAPA